MPQSEKVCFACGNPMDQIARLCPHCGADQIRRPASTPSFGKAQPFGRAKPAAGSGQSGGFQKQKREQQDGASRTAASRTRQADVVAAEPPVDGFISAIMSCFLKYATFRGRANRAEFWYFFLFLIIAGILMALVDASISRPMIIMPSGVWNLATLLPQYAVSVRRLHDVDKSGFYALLPLLALILLFAGAMYLVHAKQEGISGDLGYILLSVSGALILWLVVLYCLPGTPGSNRYGPGTHSW